MVSDKYIKAILYLAIAAWAVILYFNGQALSSALLKPLSTVTTIVVFVVLAFDLWLWKLPFLHDWFVSRPVIDGTWRVEIRSNWVDPATGAHLQPIEGYMVVRQTFSTLSLRLLTQESSSEFVGTEIVCSVDKLYCVSGVYRNEPRYEVRGRSAIHYGAVWLKILSEPKEAMTGHYWTDRNTAGEIELGHRRKLTFQDFQSAQNHFGHQRIART